MHGFISRHDLQSWIFGGEIGGVLNSSACVCTALGMGGENDIHHLIVILQAAEMIQNEPYCALLEPHLLN